jgi:hypothetical protein
MNTCTDSKDIAQTLFLGASVSSFFANMGWSGQPSQLTVNLVVDSSNCFGGTHIRPVAGYDTDNHYYTCSGDACYVDRDGSSWNSANAARRQARADGTIINLEDKIIPGKLKYKFVTSNGIDPFVSNYWYDQDPGFLGSVNKIDINGVLSGTSNNGYDIIGTPVFFKMGNFTFGGLVQSWEENLSSGGQQYKIVIDGMQSLLSNCYIITGQYGGAVFSRLNNMSAYGSPRNYVGKGTVYSGSIAQGNIPNLFNVYGFLESAGPENFGGSNVNEEGLSASSIILALRVLTSSISEGSSLSEPASTGSFLSGPKTAFSPYGRIIAKKAQTYSYDPISSNFVHWGIIPPQTNALNGGEHCEFLLDLSDLPTPPSDFRVKGPVVSILDFLNIISEAGGYDYSVDMIPAAYNNAIYNIIKVRQASRRSQPATNIISSTINALFDQGYNITSNTIGQERNDSPARCVLIGGPQQRLYQAKSYRMAYTQTNFIFDVSSGKFVDYLALGNILANYNCENKSNNSLTRNSTGLYRFGKIKFPSLLSTRNSALSATINGNLSALFSDDETIKNTVDGIGFNDDDNVWRDAEITAQGPARNSGNYEKARNFNYTFASTWGTSAQSKISEVNVLNTPYTNGRKPHQQRFFPLYKDVICPFFGFMMDQDFDISTSTNNRDFRRVRPVFLDTWTGQICVLFRASELPMTRVDLNGLYSGYNLYDRHLNALKNLGLSGSGTDSESGSSDDTPTFTSNPRDWFFLVTESEMRAALVGADEFLVYTIGKDYKTDIFTMLHAAYYTKALAQYGDANRALEATRWEYSISTDNISNLVLGAAPNHPEKGDGLGFIEEAARQDFEILAGFVKNIATKYYGKQYMVAAPYVSARKDSSYSGVSIPTALGPAYVYQGGAKLSFNYQPTNDGAWEEYGNIIDDSIAVGTKNWINLTNEQGLIAPILGYNATYAYDKIGYDLCRTSISDDELIEYNNPYFSYSSFEAYKLSKASTCSASNFTFPSLNTSQLEPAAFVVVGSNLANNDAFNNSDVAIPRQKLYMQTQVSESFVFLDPEQLRDPRIIIDSVGIPLNSSAYQFQEDLGRSMAANICKEDLCVYLRSTAPNKWSCDYILRKTAEIQKINRKAIVDMGKMSSNPSSRLMRLAPKMAHPFFAGIPIRSNQFNYGPWTNYPALDISGDNIFPGKNNTQALSAINNWVLPTSVEVVPDFVPWNYGGMSFLDRVAYQEVKSRVNYQSVIETASVEMAGLPIFNIGGFFDPQILNNVFPITLSADTLTYTEIKRSLPAGDFSGSISEFNQLTNIDNWTYSSPSVLSYRVLNSNYISGSNTTPIVTHINISIGADGVKTSYGFRTYTRKLSLFNKEYSDRLKKSRQEAIYRDKQLAKITQQINSNKLSQAANIASTGFNPNERTSVKELESKLKSWSPVEVVVASAAPYIREPDLSSPYRIPENEQNVPEETGTTSEPSYSISVDNDPGTGGIVDNGLADNSTSIPFLSSLGKVTTSAQIYEMKELPNTTEQDYGTKSVMSLDGLFSPVSFYPTDGLSTFSFSKYEEISCPVCQGTKKRTLKFKRYSSVAGTPSAEIKQTVVCDACCNPSEKLNSKLMKSSSANNKNYREILPPFIITNNTDSSSLASLRNSESSSSSIGYGTNVPINLVSLQPIVVPFGEFKHPNAQNYTGAHPDGHHAALTIGNKTRNFIDRSRHSISIVGRSVVPQKRIKIDDTTIGIYERENTRHNPAFFHRDLAAIQNLKTLDSSNYSNINPENNQRFVGLRGPLVVHGWGYDTEGYPVPNAADEPLEIDSFNRPKRFKIKQTTVGGLKYDDLEVGDLFSIGSSSTVLTKAKSLAAQNSYGDGYTPGPPALINLETTVSRIVYEDDLSDAGGFDENYKGSIISKTQKFEGGAWTSKKKLNEFYLNWAEHPEVWPVGPIDLRWDANRRVWVSASSIQPPYKMVYITLEEDLTIGAGMTETYPAKGFLDDIEYSSIPLDSGYRRLVWVRDRSAYTAPRGARLLCRYDSDSGYYEPVSKPSFSVLGNLREGSAMISMSYIEGIKKGENAPTMQVSYSNPLGFQISPNTAQKGLFTFMSGRWTLTATKEE